jgi:ribosome-associated protein
MAKSETIESPNKLELIVEALKEVKGKNIVVINLEKVHNAICDYFVICHGDSTSQVDGLSDSVARKVKSELSINAHHIEGKNNSLWVLMDYSEILVHIFLGENRSFYNLEDLWADGVLEKIEDHK